MTWGWAEGGMRGRCFPVHQTCFAGSPNFAQEPSVGSEATDRYSSVTHSLSVRASLPTALHSLLRGAARLMDVSGSMRRRRPASDLEAIAGDWSAVMADFARACASVSAEENTDDEGPDRGIHRSGCAAEKGEP
jgi:hypothetical protein